MLDINQIYLGDCLEVLKEIEDSSIDSIVTDPPYELGFMSRKWDQTGIAYNVDLWKECLRVLKPGGHILVAGIGRTHHRVMVAIEDAGFEIRDCIYHLFGSGFPKSKNISKAIDKRLGVEREVIGKSDSKGIRSGNESKQYDGWGTHLKPACEIWVLARKPLSEKNIADNVLKWGTGGINIDGCRIGTQIIKTQGGQKFPNLYGKYNDCKESYHQGRFPANVILDEEAGRMLDEQSGITKSGKVKTDKEAYEGTSNTGFLRGKSTSQNQHGDSGGASRFFYCAKASRKERGEYNNHPTVKPLKLMRYLVRLITPPNGVVLDPFTGSGTTLIAAYLEGFNYIGIEQNEEYINIANRRIEEFRKE